MILNNSKEELNLSFRLKIDGFDYVLFATSDVMKCFGCGKEGHVIRVCPEKPAGTESGQTAGEGTSGQKEAGKKGGISDKEQRGRAEMKNREEETGGDNSGDGEQMEGGNQTVSCREKDTSNCQSISDEGNEAGESQQSCETVGADIENNEEEENGEDEDEEDEEEEDETQNSKTAGPEEILAGSADIDMVGEESSLTITRQKRKSEIDSKGSKAKKVTVSKDKQKQTVKESMAEYDSSVEGRLDVSLNKITPGELNEQIYGVEKIKLFLQKTKNVKGVKVESFFPDKEAFLNSVKSQLRAKGREGLTEQEVYRLRKIVVKIRHELNEEDGIKLKVFFFSVCLVVF